MILSELFENAQNAKFEQAVLTELNSEFSSVLESEEPIWSEAQDKDELFKSLGI